jgi:hypothetical protein
MSRSKKKGPYIDANLVEKVQALKKTGDKKADQNLGTGQCDRAGFCGHNVRGA